MKTLKPVDEETYARIGKAYLICSEYPEVFGDVTFKKFCSMFVDALDEKKREARMRKYAPDMYRLLKDIRSWSEEKEVNDERENRLYEEMCATLRVIDGTEDEDE